MKQFAILLVAALLFSCNQNPNKGTNLFTLEGNIQGLELDTMYRNIPNPAMKNGYSYDTILVKDGKFSYTFEVENPELITIYPRMEKLVKRVDENGYFPTAAAYITFIAEPGQVAKIDGDIQDFMNAYPSGNQSNDELAILIKQTFPLINKGVNYRLNSVLNRGDTALVDKNSAEIKLLEEEVLKINQKFIEENPSSFVSLFQLSQLVERNSAPEEWSISQFKNLGQNLHSHEKYMNLAIRINAIETTKVGNPAPTFVSDNTYNNTTFAIEQLKGKYVVIDFWGTWCGPCIYEMPKMKEYYDRYKDKMEIVGIAQESSNDRWYKFLEKNDYPWTQVLNDKKENDLVVKYNVHSFPTKFVLDQDGKIIQKYVGGVEGFYEFMDQILGE